MKTDDDEDLSLN